MGRDNAVIDLQGGFTMMVNGAFTEYKYITRFCLTYGHSELRPHEYGHHKLFCQSSREHLFLPAVRCHHELHLNHYTQFN